MEILIFGAGAFVGIFLGILLHSRFGLAKRADGFSYLSDGAWEATPLEDSYYVLPLETLLPAAGRERWPPRHGGEAQPGQGELIMPAFPEAELSGEGACSLPSGLSVPGPIVYRPYRRQ